MNLPGNKSVVSRILGITCGMVLLVLSLPVQAEWERISGQLAQISVGRANHVWGVNNKDQIFRWDGFRWLSVSGLLKQVSVGEDGVVWGVNAGGQIFERTPSGGWREIPGLARTVSVGSASTIWALNDKDQIFRWTGNTWQSVPGLLQSLGAASDGSVWGVNAQGGIFELSNNAQWIVKSGQAFQVSVGGARHIWVVNKKGDIFRWQNGRWELVPGNLKQIAVGSDGTVWGINAEGAIFRYRTSMECTTTANCPANKICRSGTCVEPSGECDPNQPPERFCFPGAICAKRSSGGGVCSFGLTAETPATSFGNPPPVRLLAPEPGDWFDNQQVFRLRWEVTPTMRQTGAVTMAFMMTEFPFFHLSTRQITNINKISWIWSSVSPSSGRNGDVRIDQGFTGIRASGDLDSPWPSGQGLPSAAYRFFVMVTVNGVISNVSPVRLVKVGHPCNLSTISRTGCSVSADCVTVIQTPEQASCGPDHKCRLRCASDFDCCGSGNRCDFSLPVDNLQGGICRPR